VTSGDDVERALAELRAGRPVVLPTDTVYGIAALPGVTGAVEAVFAAKGRPEAKPLPVLAARLDDLEAIAELAPAARRLAHAFWPGPLTVVVPRARGLVWDLGSGPGSTIALRIPDCDVALRLLSRSGPLAVTSANRSGESPATTVAEARAALGEAVRVFVDGGPRGGAVSTIVSVVDRPQVLRGGAIPEREVFRALDSGAERSPNFDA
jgi:tRNA threonylcarbamoyl adenosine modification protein (Sua5/YciO/YrdC/YwlC family)